MNFETYSTFGRFQFYLREPYEFQITRKPEGIDDIGAAGILYAGLTAWSSLYISGLAGGLQGAKTSKGSDFCQKTFIFLFNPEKPSHRLQK